MRIRPPHAAGAFAVGELGGGERGHRRAERFGQGVDDPSSAPDGACLGVAGGGARTDGVEELVEGAAQWREATVRVGGGRHQFGRVESRGEGAGPARADVVAPRRANSAPTT